LSSSAPELALLLGICPPKTPPEISVLRFNPNSRNEIAVRPQTAFQTQRISILRFNPPRYELKVPNPEANLTASNAVAG